MLHDIVPATHRCIPRPAAETRKRIILSHKLYVGGLSFSSSEDSIRALFTKSGTVASVAIIKDCDTGHSKGFGFVEMSSAADAQAAIRTLDGRDFEGRRLTVNEAKPRGLRDGHVRN